MYCKKCGKIIPDDSVFCLYCGEIVEVVQPAQTIEKEYGHCESRDTQQASYEPDLHTCILCGEPLYSDDQVMCKTCIQKSRGIDVTHNQYKPHIQRSKIISSFVCFTLIIVIVAMALNLNIPLGVSTNTDSVANNSSSILAANVENVATSVSLSQYSKISTGMTYDEVVAITGFDGVENSSAGSGAYQITLISWKGNGGFGASMCVSFTGGLVSGKSQFSLK